MRAVPSGHASDDDLDELIHRGDLDALVRMIDDRCSDRDWPGLLRVRDRSRHAVETGRQLWPAATLAEYRLALLAPAEFVAAVLDESDGLSGRFTIGPLTEVAAQHHTWDELAPVLDRGPRAAFVAHERVLRGEPIEPRRRSPAGARPAVRTPDWEPEYALAAYSDGGAEFPMPDLPADVDRRRDRRRRNDSTTTSTSRPPVDRTVARQLERPARRVVRRRRRCRRDRCARRPARPDRAARRRRRRWRGSRGPARAAVPTVADAVRRRAASVPGGCSRRSATWSTTGRSTPDELGAARRRAARGTAGTPTSRRSAGRCRSRSRTSPTAPPGRSTPATPPDDDPSRLGRRKRRRSCDRCRHDARHRCTTSAVVQMERISRGLGGRRGAAGAPCARRRRCRDRRCRRSGLPCPC